MIGHELLRLRGLAGDARLVPRDRTNLAAVLSGLSRKLPKPSLALMLSLRSLADAAEARTRGMFDVEPLAASIHRALRTIERPFN